MSTFMQTLEEQRWDDHRYYHHNRINQLLHLLSSLCFILMYFLLFTEPVVAVLLGWAAMSGRQVGHFVFEPKGYDDVNEASHAYKESVKVGFNLRRKVLLYCVWGVTTVAYLLDPTLLGLFTPPETRWALLTNLSRLWLAVGIGGLLFRTVHLFFLKDVQTGLVWFTKIISDPFHDVMLYYRSPAQLLRGEMYDPEGPRRHPEGPRSQAA